MYKLFLCLLLMFNIFRFAPKETTNSDELNLYSSSVILVEASSRKIIYESNMHEKHYPASMTKMMGMYLVLSAIEKGSLHFEDKVTCGEYAASMGGTQIYLKVGEEMTVDDLFKAVCINSANDAIAALGEHMYGSNDMFVKAMNKEAKKLGMENTNFKSCTGFDDKEHYSSCYDMSILACELVKFGETLFQYTRLKEAYLREDTSSPFWLVNTNKLLGVYDGLDGLKTGYTNLANYNLTATAKRNNVRLISVVMNEKTKEERTCDTKILLNYGFSKLKAIVLFANNDVILSYAFKKSKEELTDILVNKEVIIVVDNDVKEEDILYEVELNKTYAPLCENEIVGKLILKNKLNNDCYYFDLYVNHNVESLDFWNFLGEFILNLIV